MKNPEPMRYCPKCQMVMTVSQTKVQVDPISVVVRGTIEVPFVFTLHDIEPRESWVYTEDMVTDRVEDSMAISDILTEAHGTEKIDYIDAARVRVEEVIEE